MIGCSWRIARLQCCLLTLVLLSVLILTSYIWLLNTRVIIPYGCEGTQLINMFREPETFIFLQKNAASNFRLMQQLLWKKEQVIVITISQLLKMSTVNKSLHVSLKSGWVNWTIISLGTIHFNWRQFL